MNVTVSYRTREIGPWGTAARVLVGLAALTHVLYFVPEFVDVLLGLVAIPAAVMVVVFTVRGLHGAPIRAHAAYWHCVNIGIGIVLLNINPDAALLFYGVSMLLAAWRGIGACELLTISNLLLRRNDQLACPVFLPVDAIEAKLSGRELYCA